MDMIALKRASDGNPEQQIAVRRSLLADAYARIVELEGGKTDVVDAGGEGKSPKAKGSMAAGKDKNIANTVSHPRA